MLRGNRERVLNGWKGELGEVVFSSTLDFIFIFRSLELIYFTEGYAAPSCFFTSWVLATCNAGLQRRYISISCIHALTCFNYMGTRCVVD